MPLLRALFLRSSGRSRHSSTRAARARQVSMDREKLKRSMERKRLFSEAEDEAMLRAWLRCAPLPHRVWVWMVGPLHDANLRAAQHPCCRACGACALPRQEPASPRPRLRLRRHGRWYCSAPITMRLSPPRAGGTRGTASPGRLSRRRATAWPRSACWSRRRAPARRAPPRSRTRRRRAFGPAGTCRPPAWSVETCQAGVGALAAAPCRPDQVRA